MVSILCHIFPLHLYLPTPPGFCLLFQARRYVSGERVFAHIEKEETPRALEQLSITLSVCTSFKETYASYKDTATAGECRGQMEGMCLQDRGALAIFF
jgi:hypothetical protein